jgi:trehalose 6-phosphate phosphatase
VYESVSGSDNAHGGVGLRDLVDRVLGVLGGGQTGLVTDVDGTISPIVARPEEAMVLPRAREALVGLRDLLTVVAVVTGRSVSEARRIVDVDGLTYIGNHGLETFSHGQPAMLPQARPWVPRLVAVLGQVAAQLSPDVRQAVIIENKGATASLHYRLAPNVDQVRRELLDALAPLAAANGLVMEEGRRVINLLPPLRTSKGSAVTWLVREHRLEGIVYLGDDLTDAHAFEALSRLRQAAGVRTLSIGVVGPETPPRIRELADASLPTVTSVADLLSRVVEGLKSSARMESRAHGIGSELNDHG